MRILNQIENKLEPFAIRHLTMHIVLGQILLLGMSWIHEGSINYFVLIPDKILQGEVWRLFSYLFVPPNAHPLFLAFIWYLLWFMGNELENHWGSFRYNLFWLSGSLASIAAASTAPQYIATNSYLMGSVLLAFAFLRPNFRLMILFILPIEIKWLALLTWIFYGYTALIPHPNEPFLILAIALNFLLFFGKSLIKKIMPQKR